MAEQWDIEGKTFLITGGASGLGALYGEAFLKKGAKNVALLDIAEDLGKGTETKLNSVYPNKVTFIKCDVNDEENITKAFEKVLSLFKQIDVLINNAGILMETPAMWRSMCNINLEGVISFTMKGLEHMRKDRGGAGGTIINISSTAALTRFQQLPMYSGTKMGILHFSETLAMEPNFSRTGVRVLVLCPGASYTPILSNLDKRCHDEETGKEFREICEKLVHKQKPEAVVKSIEEMYKRASNGSIWMSVNDKPAQDITPLFDNLFKQLATLF